MEEKVYFKTSDGIKLCGILSVPKNPTQKCIILCHGITVDKEEDGNYVDLISGLPKLGYAVFRFDFRGHGESQGRSMDVTVAGEVMDLEAAIRFLQEKGFRNFGLISASFAGGAVSFFVAKHQEIVRALALWYSGIDYGEWINPTLLWPIKHFGKPAFERAEKFGFTEIGSRKFRIGRRLMEEIKVLKPWEQLLKISIPVLFVHGDKDKYVNVKDSIKYSGMMKNAKLEIIKGADHGFHEKPEFAEQGDKATIEFFQENM